MDLYANACAHWNRLYFRASIGGGENVRVRSSSATKKRPFNTTIFKETRGSAEIRSLHVPIIRTELYGVYYVKVQFYENNVNEYIYYDHVSK